MGVVNTICFKILKYTFRYVKLVPFVRVIREGFSIQSCKSKLLFPYNKTMRYKRGYMCTRMHMDIVHICVESGRLKEVEENKHFRICRKYAMD
jgi:hypothetical protein